MLSTELEKSNCKTYHAPGDADLLIVQKAVQSATTSKTVLVGEDTDLIVLLCYHASLDSHDLFFRPEPPKKNTKKLRVWNIRATKEKLVKTSATTSSSSMLFLGVTQHPVFMGLEKGHPLTSSKQAVCSMSRQRCSASIHDVIDAGEKALVLVYNGMLTIPSDVNVSVKRWLQKHPT